MAYFHEKTQTRALSRLEQILFKRPDNQISDDPWTVPAFFNAVRDVASAVARTDCWVRRILPNGGRENDENHPAFWLLTWKANLYTKYFDWISTLIANTISNGDGFSLITRDDIGNPTALFNLESHAVYPITEFTDGQMTNHYYGVQANGEQIIVQNDDMIHVKNLAVGTGECSLSVQRMMSPSIKKANAIQTFQYLYFQNGSHVNKVLKIPGWLSPEQKEEIKQEVQHITNGLYNSHKLIALQGGTEMESVPMNAQDMEMTAAATGVLTDTANIVGIPGTRIGDRGAISYGSLEQDNRLFAQNLDNWFTNLEAEFTVKLLRPRQQGMSHVIEFDRDSLFATDPEWKAQQVTMFEKKIITLQEVRQKLGWPSEPVGDLLEEPQPVVQQQPQDEATPAPEAEPQDNTRAITLTENVLKRIKTRLVKAVESGKHQLAEHHDIIRDELRGLNAELVVSQLNRFQEEMDAVLPEQRIGVLKQWNTPQMAQRLWT